MNGATHLPTKLSVQHLTTTWDLKKNDFFIMMNSGRFYEETASSILSSTNNKGVTTVFVIRYSARFQQKTKTHNSKGTGKCFAKGQKKHKSCSVPRQKHHLRPTADVSTYPCAPLRMLVERNTGMPALLTYARRHRQVHIPTYVATHYEPFKH